MRLLFIGICLFFFWSANVFGAPTNAPAATKKNAASPAQPRRSRTPAAVTNQPGATNAVPGSSGQTNQSVQVPSQKADPTRYGHVITASGSLFLPPFNAPDDPYGIGLGFGISYDMFWIGNLMTVPGLFAGLDFDMLFFQPKEEFAAFFGSSTLILAGVSAGYQFVFGKAGDPSHFAVALSAGYRHYFSSHVYSVTTFRDTAFSASRPAATAGLYLNYYKDFMIISGCLDYLMIFDSTVLHALVPSLRIGFVF